MRIPACADVQGVVVHLVGLRKLVDHTGGNPLQPVRIGCIADHDGKFITPKTAAQLVFGHDRLEPFRNPRQQLITNQMAKGIVDRLEPIKVDHQEGAPGAPLRGIAQRLAQRLGHHHPVGQAGQRVKLSAALR